MFSKLIFQKSMALYYPSMRSFRLNQKNPFLQPEVRITPKEIENQKDLPIWERLFDHKKYMEHEGTLKMATGLAMLDVEPFPRLKLMKLYYMTLEEIRDLPDKYEYKLLSEEITKYRMEIVDKTKNIREIEEKIDFGMIEELIYQAHSELRLLKIMKRYF